ncbi:uncharacterized protein LOC119634268 isoform X2 [Glossina fuscipes]|uniref:Uncharacterized protein LOC119634268 isoform X2 n=1 Tax=Glossina fuscipes TaxID=7396 RepID=A0A8U0WGR1_9MUSC|nr:uncharacterized protein LOC119634268 isoform X2 [Glossina fuscipes]
MAKMNNFTTTSTATETLPKSGHVNEVCKEWLVREDGALAYKLQSQEINDFYKGNRFRNAVVREDFPTALQEQIKEKETAEKQTEVYRRKLKEQEEHDKRVAKEIAEKLEKDLQEQKLQQLKEGQEMAQKMQEIYVNMPPVPPPKHQVPPPRPAKNSTLQPQQQNYDSYHNTTNGYRNPHSYAPALQQQYPLLLQQKHFSNTDGYVGLALQSTAAQHLQQRRSPKTNQNHLLVGDDDDKQSTQHNSKTTSSPQYRHHHSSSSPSSLALSVSATTTANASRRHKLSPQKYDQLVGNAATGNATTAANEKHLQEHADDIELYVDPCDYASLKEIGLPMHEIKEISEKLKQEQKDELLARRLQEMEVNDGLTQEERDRMLAIEAQDKELAKMLQERMDYRTWNSLHPQVVQLPRRHSFLSLCPSRKLEMFSSHLPRIDTSGIWEKAKAKRAKEKARQRKSQQKDNGHNGPIQPLPQDSLVMNSSTVSSTTSSTSSTKQPESQSSTLEDSIDLEAYSNPIDVIKRTQNGCLTNGSLNRELVFQQQQARHASLNREDDIYTLPVDSCRPPLTPPQATSTMRPASMSIGHEASHSSYSQNSMTRSENFSIHSQDSSNSRSKATTTFGIYTKAQVQHHLICRFKVRGDQIQMRIVKRNPRTTNAHTNKS